MTNGSPARLERIVETALYVDDMARAHSMSISSGVVPPHGAAGAQHLAFAVDRDAVAPWLERFANAGLAIESRVRWPRGGESLYVRDPDGHSVELMTPGLWAIY